jgi:hypothetical protein
VTEATRHISACWDVEQGKPLPEYYAMYARVKDEVAGLGVEFS